MRYLIHLKNAAYFTQLFDKENHFVNGMVVYDLHRKIFSTDGVTWKEIQDDTL